MRPQVSVIIPTYNRGGAVVRAVESVLSQTKADTEIVVVDDGSTDDTPERLSAFAGRMRYIRVPSGNRRGVGFARNIGLEATSGEYVAFLDSDDEWLPLKLEKQLALLKNPGVHVVYCSAYNVDISGNILSIQRARHRGRILKQLLTDNVVTGSASAVLLRRTCFEEELPFRADSAFSEDWDLWLRLAFHYVYDFAPDALVKVRVTPDSRHNSLSARDMRNSLSKIYSDLLADPRKRGYVLKHWRRCESTIAYFAGNRLRRNGQMGAARGELVRSIRFSPFQGRAYVEIGKTFLGFRLLLLLKRVRSMIVRARNQV